MAPAFWAAGLLAVAVGVLVATAPWRRSADEPSDMKPTVEAPRAGVGERAVTFDGDSSGLSATRIVPTLDTPVEADRNAVWCASLEMAWQALGRELGPGPIVVHGAEAVSARLNAAPVLDLPGDACWSWVGPSDGDGFAAARASIARWRPDASLSGFPAVPGAMMALAALEASVPFAHGFNDNDEPLLFRDAAGRETGVRSFGLRERDSNNYPAVRRQVHVLHLGWSGARNESLYEVVIDLDRSSSPHQVVLAQIEPRETLAATWAEVQARMRESTDLLVYDRLTPMDTLLVPDMSWRVIHRFGELEGAGRTIAVGEVLGPPLVHVQQEIAFRLDRSGAAVSSRSGMVTAGGPGRYEFDRPFLVVVKPRHRQTPFFVAWIANAELLMPFDADGP